MATLPVKAGHVGLVDIVNSLAPDGSIAAVAELLTQENDILKDIPFMEGNLPDGHQASIRTGLPTVAWRQLYKGTTQSKSLRATVVDSCGMLEARAEVDVKAAQRVKDIAGFRLSEAAAFLESMNQAFAETLIYGNTAVNPERFNGLAIRYSSLSAGNGVNIIDAGGTGSDNTSMWLVVYGPNKVHGIYPQGSIAGLSHKDIGEQDVLDSNGDKYRALCDLWNWDVGVHVADWRFIVRIANIDMSDLLAQTGTQAQAASTNILKAMIKAMNRVPNMSGTPVFYCNRNVKEMLSVIALDRTQSVLKFSEGLNQFGEVTVGSVAAGTLTFQGVPVRLIDRILSTEARIV